MNNFITANFATQVLNEMYIKYTMGALDFCVVLVTWKIREDRDA